MPSLSIIIPVYNIEKHLEECVESVLGQGFDDFEIILVNDGSKDSSGDICTAYGEKSSKVIAVHKENGGISSARNAGLEVAKGDYIWFLDGDDTAVSGCLDKVMPQILKDRPDIAVCRFNIGEDNMNTIVALPYFINEKMKSSANSLEIMNEYYKNPDGMWSVPRHIYRRNFIVENGFAFDTGLPLAEDCEFNMNVFPKAKKFLFIQQSLFNYRINREGSLSSRRNADFVRTNVIVFAKWIKHFSSLDSEVSVNFIVGFLSKMFYDCIIESFYIKDKTSQKQIFSLIYRHRFVFKYIEGLKQKILLLYILLFGLPMGRRLYMITHGKKAQ
ncbi:MAG: glycosyltransferase [Eubacteriales bacterium]|jgi:glycosyltransferase involved in cell wall biosynthesis|nr:glycosyltransferase [Eubacteriales bacterium]